MPAWITNRRHIRVTFPGFDKTLTNWRGKRLRDFPIEQVEKLCDYMNQSILMGNTAAVKTWFPGERTKHLVKRLAYTWLEAIPKADSTIKMQQRDLEHFILPEIGDKVIQEVTRQNFYWIRENHGDTHMARRLRCECRALMNWAWKEGLTDKQIFPPSVRVPAKPTPYIELKDRWGIWELVDDEACKPSLVLSIEMGLRVGEVVALQWDCIDFDAGLLRIVRHVSGTKVVSMRKAGDEYWAPWDMPYSQKAKELLSTLKPSQIVPWLFHGEQGNHLQVDRVSKAFKRAARRYGLPQAYLHQCRHSSIKDRIADGYSLEEVQAIHGHKSKATTEIYKGPGIRHLRKLAVMGERE